MHNILLSRIKTLKDAVPPQQCSPRASNDCLPTRHPSPPVIYRDVRYRYNNARAAPLQRVRVLDRDPGMCVCLSDFPVSEIRPRRCGGAILLYSRIIVVVVVVVVVFVVLFSVPLS